MDLLHQIYNGMWQGSVREQGEADATYPSRADSAEVCLLTAFGNALNGVGRRVVAHGVFTGPPLDQPKADLSSILNRLHPQAPFQRRF